MEDFEDEGLFRVSKFPRLRVPKSYLLNSPKMKICRNSPKSENVHVGKFLEIDKRTQGKENFVKVSMLLLWTLE